MRGRMVLREAVALAIAVLACEAVGAGGSRFTVPAVKDWYPTLAMPAFAPPPWLFAPVWTALYAAMGVAAFLVWRRRGDDPRARGALLVFGLQLLLNALWSPAFFGLRSPLAGLVVIVPLLAAILVAMLRFFAVSRLAGVLMVPYLGWVGFATVLNAAIVVLNR